MTTRTRKRPAAKRRPAAATREAEQEPTSRATVAGTRGVPAARSWIRDAGRVHEKLVRARLAELPGGGRVVRVSDWGDQSSVWAVCHDHGGWFEVPYDEDAAARELASLRARSHSEVGAGRRFLRLVVLLAVVALATWTTTILLDASHAELATRNQVGLIVAAVVVVVGSAWALRSRRGRSS